MVQTGYAGGDDTEGELRFTAEDVPAGEWVRLEIPLSEFMLATSGAISQMIFSSRDVDGNASLDTVYVANAFLSVDEATPMDSGEGGEGHHDVTDPTEGPMSPELAATEGFAAATAWGNYYGGSGTAVSEVDLGGTTVKKYTNLDYAIAEGFSVDAGTAGLNTLHVDVWRLDDTADFGIKLVDYGSDGNWSGGDDVEGELRFTASDVPAGEWVRLEIPLSEFNLATSGSISQMIFSSRDVDGNASLDTVYVANAFLSVDEATPMDLGEGGEGHHGVTDPTEGPMSPELAATEGFAAATAWGNYYGGSGTAVSEVDLGGTTVKKYTNLDYAIAEGFSVDAGTAGLNTLHVDVWRLDDTADLESNLSTMVQTEIGVVATMWKASFALLLRMSLQVSGYVLRSH